MPADTTNQSTPVQPVADASAGHLDAGDSGSGGGGSDTETHDGFTAYIDAPEDGSGPNSSGQSKDGALAAAAEPTGPEQASLQKGAKIVGVISGPEQGEMGKPGFRSESTGVYQNPDGSKVQAHNTWGTDSDGNTYLIFGGVTSAPADDSSASEGEGGGPSPEGHDGSHSGSSDQENAAPDAAADKAGVTKSNDQSSKSETVTEAPEAPPSAGHVDGGSEKPAGSGAHPTGKAVEATPESAPVTDGQATPEPAGDGRSPEGAPPDQDGPPTNHQPPDLGRTTPDQTAHAVEAEPVSDWEEFVRIGGIMVEQWAKNEIDKLQRVWNDPLGRGFVAGMTGLPIDPPSDPQRRDAWDKGQDLAAVAALADMISGGIAGGIGRGGRGGPPGLEPAPVGGGGRPPGAGVRDTPRIPPAHLSRDTPPASPKDAQAAAARSRARADELAAATGYTGQRAGDGTIGVAEVQRTVPTPEGPRIETKVLVAGSSPEVQARLKPLLRPNEELVTRTQPDAKHFEGGENLHAEHETLIKLTRNEFVAEGWVPTGGAASNQVCATCRSLVENPDLGGHVLPDKKSFWFAGPRQ